MDNVVPNLMVVGLHHETYWIRLAVQRVYGSIFQTQMRNSDQLSVTSALGYTEEKEVADFLYKMVSVFKFKPIQSEELGTQLVKNLTFLLRSLISAPNDRMMHYLPKLFSRCSFVARKMMLNVSEAKGRIANVLLFFQVAFHLFESIHTTDVEEPKKDNELSRSVLNPVLELVYRIYTDDQYKESRAKELASELVDYLSTGLDKTFFISAYNEVKSGISKKRDERRK